MEELEYLYDEGVNFKIVHGEDGYTVNIESVNPLMGTFATFDEMLFGIAPIVQQYAFDILDVEAFAIALDVNFKNELGDNGITEILMK